MNSFRFFLVLFIFITVSVYAGEANDFNTARQHTIRGLDVLINAPQAILQCDGDIKICRIFKSFLERHDFNESKKWTSWLILAQINYITLQMVSILQERCRKIFESPCPLSKR